MSTKRIVWQAPDGSIHVTTPVEPPLPGESEADYLDRIAARAAKAPVLAGCKRVAHVEATDLPSRRFRQAWRWQGSKVAADLDAAKVLLEGEIPRRAKAPPDKVARIRAAAARAKSVAELEALCAAEGWKTAHVPVPADTSGEDL